MSTPRGLAVCIAAAIGLATQAAAQTVRYSGGSPSGQAGYDIFNDFRAGDDFTLLSGTSFNTLRFWGILPDGVTPGPRPWWQILADAGGLPGAPVLEGLATAVAAPRGASATPGFTSWQFDSFVGSQTLSPGTYWLALHDGGAADITDSGLLWEGTAAGAGNGFAVEFLPTLEWTAPWDGDLAFELQQSDVVLDGGAPSGNAGYDAFNDFQPADDFQVSGPLAFDALRFWGLLPGGSSYTPNIFWQILADAGGAPGAMVLEGSALASGSLRTPLGGTGFDSWQFELALGPHTLGAGIYWLALHDGAVGDITDSSLIWETTPGGLGSSYAVEFLPTAEWTAPWDGNLAFQLRQVGPGSVVPEPGTLLLLGSGLAALAAAGRRWRTRRPAAR